MSKTGPNHLQVDMWGEYAFSTPTWTFPIQITIHCAQPSTLTLHDPKLQTSKSSPIHIHMPPQVQLCQSPAITQANHNYKPQSLRKNYAYAHWVKPSQYQYSWTRCASNPNVRFQDTSQIVLLYILRDQSHVRLWGGWLGHYIGKLWSLNQHFLSSKLTFGEFLA